MNRRFSLLLILLTAALCASCANKPAMTPAVAGIAVPPRVLKNLNPNWKFIRQDVPGAEQSNFDDSSWESINLPHTWNGRDGEDGMAVIKDGARGDYYRGVGWYRRHLTLDPKQINGKSVFLRFDAASIEADVFVNGKHAGNHKG